MGNFPSFRVVFPLKRRMDFQRLYLALGVNMFNVAAFNPEVRKGGNPLASSPALCASWRLEEVAQVPNYVNTLVRVDANGWYCYVRLHWS